MYKIANILPANIPIKMAIINMYKTILVSDTTSLLAPPAGIEPATFWLTVRCSTAELRRNFYYTSIITWVCSKVKCLFRISVSSLSTHDFTKIFIKSLNIINKKKFVDFDLAKYYDKDFWEENGWVSCFECDIIFYDLEKLFEHQNIHIDEEKS